MAEEFNSNVVMGVEDLNRPDFETEQFFIEVNEAVSYGIWQNIPEERGDFRHWIVKDLAFTNSTLTAVTVGAKEDIGGGQPADTDPDMISVGAGKTVYMPNAISYNPSNTNGGIIASEGETMTGVVSFTLVKVGRRQ